MIQIYSLSNTDYEHNGDCVLTPVSCEISAELNGAWSLTLVHPLDDKGRWKYIEENAVLKVPTWMATKLQRYRIRTVEKTNDTITALAYPVFFDSANDAFVLDVRGVNKLSSQILTMLFEGAPAKYTFTTDNTTDRETETFQNCSLLEAITGKYLEKWKVELLYNNNQLIANTAAGGDYGVSVQYGKNILGVQYSVDMTDVVTRIIPYAYNGRMMTGDTPWVSSSLVSSYPKVFIRAMQFNNIKLADDATEDDEEDESITICNTQSALNTALANACRDMFADGIDRPKISMSIDMLALEDTEEYAGFSGLEQIGLGDTVYCQHAKLGIVSTAKVVGIRWDCARDRIAGCTLGAFEYDYFRDTQTLDEIQMGLEEVLANLNPDGSIMAERVRGILNGMNTVLQIQQNAAQRQDVVAILLEDLEPNSLTYGALGIGTQGIQISKTRTADGRAWSWTTAITSNGIYATNALVGLISNTSANNWWDLDNDQMHITANYFRLAGSGGTTKTIEQVALDGMTQTDVFNKLTNNGDLDGIFMQDGQLYINLFYLRGGAIQIGRTVNGSFVETFFAGRENGTDGVIRIKGGRVHNGEFEERFYVDSTTGAVRIKASTFSLSGSTIPEIVEDEVTTALSNYDPEDELTQEGIFNILTNNGTNSGIWLRTNSSTHKKELYLNFDYAEGGTLKLGGRSNNYGALQVRDASGNVIASIDKDGVKFCTTTGFTGEHIDIDENIIKGFVNTTQYSMIDMCANVGQGIRFVINANGNCDALVLSATNKPLILDAGTSTIQPNSHFSTLTVDGNVAFKAFLTVDENIQCMKHIFTDKLSCNDPALYPSDRKLKENIEDTERQTESVMKLKVRSFDWKKDGRHVSAGFIAQELQEVYPELVEESNGSLAIATTGLIPHLTKVIQEQNERITALEETVKKLTMLMEDRK